MKIMNIAQLLLFTSIYLCVCVYLVASRHAVGSNEVENDDEFCTIETENGRVHGKQNRTLLEKKPFYSFRGISFAKPPLGHLRFKVN